MRRRKKSPSPPRKTAGGCRASFDTYAAPSSPMWKSDEAYHCHRAAGAAEKEAT
ncbi:MAG: hypothetical protein R3B72_36590 [Polyangiaceae bacterium]